MDETGWKRQASRPDRAALLETTLRRAGPDAENWDTRAALLWVLVVAERFGTVEESLKPMLAQVHRCGSARGFVAAYSTLGLLRLRCGALPEADAAARVALRVLREGDFAPGLGDVAVEEGAFTGTHNGVLHGPAGDIAPTGRRVTVGYIQVLRFRDGKHVSFNLMYDRLLLLEQLGLLPAPA